MAWTPDDELARLNREVSVERLAVARGVVLVERNDRLLVGSCPWCAGTMTLVVDRVANTWVCSCCQEGGGAVGWVMRAEGVSQRHAVELLREGLPVVGDAGKPPPKRASTAKLPAPFETGLADGEVLDVVAGFYHRTLRESPDEPMGLLERRGLGSAELVDVFRLGYSNRTLGYRVPNAQRLDGETLRKQLQGIGVLAPSGHEAFMGSLVVPLHDVDGRVVQLYGRKTGPKLRAGTRLHTWLPRPVPLFNTAALGSGEVVLCGSVLDALTLWAAGIRNVIAVDRRNSGGFADEHLSVIAEAGVGKVLIAFERSDVGVTDTEHAAKRLLDVGVESFRVEFAQGMDANDYALSVADPAGALARVVRSAVWLGKGTTPTTRRQPSPPATAATTPADTPDDVDVVAEDVVEDLAEGDDATEVDGPPVGDGEAVVSPVPHGPPVETDAVLDGEDLVLVVGDRRWRVRGLGRNTSFDVLRVQVFVSVPGQVRGAGFHVDHFDLYSARARQGFLRDAAVEIGVDEKTLKRDLGRVFFAAEALVEEAIRRAQEPVDTKVELDADERAAALELLRDPALVDRIGVDFARAGMVGESTNCLVGYLAAVSRKLAQPLAIIVQSTSAAGKSALMEAVLDFVPGEERIKYSAMTGQSLYYMGEGDLAHKVLAIAEEEGAERASYALKLLQSEGELSIASTGKDTSSGRLVTHEYRVTGPAAIFLTTTAIDIDEELLNRCIVLTVDENRDQTRAIHVRQRQGQMLEGLVAASERDAVLKVHRDAQRLLESVAVVNPFADRLGFCDGATRTRRDHMKYLTLIRAIALLHQHQRPRHTATTATGETLTYIEATIADVILANGLAHEVLGRSLDELPPQTRRLLDALDAMVALLAEEQSVDRDRVRFTRRDARERLGLGDTQLKVHLARLVDLELVWLHRGERAGAFVYELAWTANDAPAGRFLPGLVDPTIIDTADPPATATTPDRSGSDNTRSDIEPGRSGSGRVGRPARSGNGRTPAEGSNPQANDHKPADETAKGPKRTLRGPAKNGGRTRSRPPAATPDDVQGDIDPVAEEEAS